MVGKTLILLGALALLPGAAIAQQAVSSVPAPTNDPAARSAEIARMKQMTGLGQAQTGLVRAALADIARSPDGTLIRARAKKASRGGISPQ